jgi:hypothetical protein
MMLAKPVQADKCQAAFRRRSMNRELALKIVLAVVGLLFIALGSPWWFLSDKTLRFLCSSARTSHLASFYF